MIKYKSIEVMYGRIFLFRNTVSEFYDPYTDCFFVDPKRKEKLRNTAF